MVQIPKNVLKQKALLQDTVFHTSFLVLFPDSSFTSLHLGNKYLPAGHSRLLGRDEFTILYVHFQ